jgi:hypothetical protein
MILKDGSKAGLKKISRGLCKDCFTRAKMGSKKYKLPSGTWIERDLFNSKAFWALKGAAPQLLIRFLGKRNRSKEVDRKGQKNNQWTNLDSLTMTYAELMSLWTEPYSKKKIGLTQPRITRAIDELLAKGFLEIKNPGGAYQQDKAVYALIDKWRIWHPGTIFSKRKFDAHRGYQR